MARFNDDDIRRTGLPGDVMGLIHDLCYHHPGRDVANYVKRAQEILKSPTVLPQFNAHHYEHSHTFHYTDQADFVSQLDAMRVKLTEAADLTPYHIVMARYPHLSGPAFCQRLRRFKGEYPHEKGKCGRKTLKLFVTEALDQHLRK